MRAKWKCFVVLLIALTTPSLQQSIVVVTSRLELHTFTHYKYTPCFLALKVGRYWKAWENCVRDRDCTFTVLHQRMKSNEVIFN